MNIHEAARSVIDALDAEGVPYMLTGALASMYYGISRSTLDADFLVQLEPARLGAVMRRLGPAFQLEPQAAFEIHTGKPYRTIKVAKTPLQIDLFPISDEPFDQERFRRRRIVAILERQVPIPTAEDMVIIKLRRQRRKDLDDARDVLALQLDRLDRSYLEKWCREQGTWDQLQSLLAEITGS